MNKHINQNPDDSDLEPDSIEEMEEQLFDDQGNPLEIDFEKRFLDY